MVIFLIYLLFSSLNREDKFQVLDSFTYNDQSDDFEREPYVVLFENLNSGAGKWHVNPCLLNCLFCLFKFIRRAVFVFKDHPISWIKKTMKQSTWTYFKPCMTFLIIDNQTHKTWLSKLTCYSVNELFAY